MYISTLLYFNLFGCVFASLFNTVLDISKTSDHLLNKHNVHVSGDRPLRSFSINPPTELDKISYDGVPYLLDRNVLTDRLVAGVSVYWVENSPSLIQLFSDNAITYLSYSDGKFNVEGVLSGYNTKLSTVKVTPEKVVTLTIDLEKINDYNDGNVIVKVNKLDKFDNDGYKYYNIYQYQSDYLFTLKNIINGNGNIQTGFNDDEGYNKNIYLYKWYTYPLVLEFVKYDGVRLVYYKSDGNKWYLSNNFPEYKNPLYPYRMLELLRSINTYFNNEIIIDASITPSGTKTYHSIIKIIFGNINKVSNQNVNVRTYLSTPKIGSYKCVHNINKPFKVRHIMYNKKLVPVKVPYTPVLDVYIYYVSFYNTMALIVYHTIDSYIYYQFSNNKWIYLGKSNTFTEGKVPKRT